MEPKKYLVEVKYTVHLDTTKKVIVDATDWDPKEITNDSLLTIAEGELEDKYGGIMDDGFEVEVYDYKISGIRKQ